MLACAQPKEAGGAREGEIKKQKAPSENPTVESTSFRVAGDNCDDATAPPFQVPIPVAEPLIGRAGRGAQDPRAGVRRFEGFGQHVRCQSADGALTHFLQHLGQAHAPIKPPSGTRSLSPNGPSQLPWAGVLGV